MASYLKACQRLALAPDADERAVRRAYARELKQINQVLDPAAFQFLREAYELVLEQVRRSTAGLENCHEPIDDSASRCPILNDSMNPGVDTQDSEREQPPLMPELEPSAPLKPCEVQPYAGSSAHAIFDDLLAALTENTEGIQGVADLLKAALADARMIALDVRPMFEYLIACHLANGWQPGNELLFAVAPDFFLWEEERPRLDRFGAIGERLNQAIDETLLLDHLSPDERQQQIGLIRRLQRDQPTNEVELLGDLIIVRKLIEKYPILMEIIVNQKQIELWFAHSNVVMEQIRTKRMQEYVKISQCPGNEDHSEESFAGWAFTMAYRFFLTIFVTSFLAILVRTYFEH